MSEGGRKDNAPPGSGERKRVEKDEENRFDKMVDRLSKSVVGITGLVLALGALGGAIFGVVHELTSQASPSPHSSATAGPHSSATISSPPSSASSSSANSQSPTGEAKIIKVTPVGSSCNGARLSVEVDISSSITGPGQLWIMVAVALKGSGTVYDAKTMLVNKTGIQTASVVKINTTRGSSRMLFVASADNSAEFTWLRNNNKNDANSIWDPNRRDLHGVTKISSSSREETTC